MLAVGAIIGLLAPAAHAAPRSGSINADINPFVKKGRLVPPDFLGLSLGYKSLPLFTGARGFGVNEVTVQLMRNLDTSGALPGLRLVDGDSAQWSDNPLAPRGFGIVFNLHPGYTNALSDFLRRAPMGVLVSVNFAANDPGIAAGIAAAFQERLPRGSIKGFEIGNEPDLYPERIQGYSASGKVIPARQRKRWGIERYLREIRTMSRSVRKAVPGARVAGPGALQFWLKYSRRVAKAMSGGKQSPLLTFHNYGLSVCKHIGRKDPTRFTLDKFLSDKPFLASTLGFLRTVDRLPRGVRLRVSETNATTCGAVVGTTDAFAASLWGAENLFQLASAGVSGVDIHASNQSAPIFPRYRNGRFAADVNGLYYSMLLFARATAGGARVLPTLETSKIRNWRNARLWATDDGWGRTRVVVVNRNRKRGGTVSVRIRGAGRTAKLERLTAPSLHSRAGIRLAGQGFTLPTFTGKPVGRRVSETVRRGRDGRFRFRVRRAEAVLVSVATPRR